MRYFCVVIVLIIALSGVFGCARDADSPGPGDSGADGGQPTAAGSPHTDQPSLTDPKPDAGDNSIDRAFVRIAAERGFEPDSNTTYSYLYALVWQKEFAHLSLSLSEETNSQSSDIYLSDHQLKETALGYAQRFAESDDAAVQFIWIARYYRMLVYDCLARFDELGIGRGIHTREEELYDTLNAVNYSMQLYDNYTVAVSNILEDPGNPMPVFADLREHDIYLSFAPPFGAVLSAKGKEFLFPWSNGELTPRVIVPRLFLSDFDVDGADELAVILYVGSGTGVAIQELHIVELESMRDSVVTGESFERLLFHRMSASYDPATDLVAIVLDDQALHADASKVDKVLSNEFRGLDLRSIIDFDVKDGVLTAFINIGLLGFDWAVPFAYMNFYTEIVYNGEIGFGGVPDITLSDSRLELPP